MFFPYHRPHIPAHIHTHTHTTHEHTYAHSLTHTNTSCSTSHHTPLNSGLSPVVELLPLLVFALCTWRVIIHWDPTPSGLLPSSSDQRSADRSACTPDPSGYNSSTSRSMVCCFLPTTPRFSTHLPFPFLSMYQRLWMPLRLRHLPLCVRSSTTKLTCCQTKSLMSLP